MGASGCILIFEDLFRMDCMGLYSIEYFVPPFDQDNRLRELSINEAMVLQTGAGIFTDTV